MLPDDFLELERYIESRDQAARHLIRPTARASIGWPSDLVQLTPYALVSLHGFSASRGEQQDAVRELADYFGFNAYHARLPGHGIDAPDAMRGLTAGALIQEAVRALAVGGRIGDRVILVGTSLGASLSLMLAAHFPELVAGVIAWSPGIRAPGARESFVRARAAAPDQVFTDENERPSHEKLVWSSHRHSDGYRAMVEFIDGFMQAPTFAQIRAPVLVGAYFESDARQDPSSCVAAMRQMYEQLGTPEPAKVFVRYPHGRHSLAYVEHPARLTLHERAVVDDAKRFISEVVLARD